MKTLLISLMLILLSACASQPKSYFEQATNTSINQYKTFSIEKLNVRGLHPDAMVKVGKAIKKSLEEKGLKFEWQDGDLTVQYAIGVENIQNIGLKLYPVGSKIYTAHIVTDNHYATMMLNIVDEKASKKIWFMSGSKRIDNLNVEQDRVNEAFVEIFKNIK